MSLIARIIDSITVKFIRSGYREVVSPVYFDGPIMQMNYAIHLLRGPLKLGEAGDPVEENSFVFLASQKPFHLRYGNGPAYEQVSRQELSDHPEMINHFLKPVSSRETKITDQPCINFVGFDVLLYNAVSLFTMLDMPPFVVPFNKEFTYLLEHISHEEEEERLGRKRLVENYTQEMVIHLCRHIKSDPKLSPYLAKLEYLSDKRLIDVILYIQSNLDKDLSNKTIASLAFISEDYVGQFFKSLTGMNLQDYVESQRLEYALKLLRTQPDTIQQISTRVGFKDAAYFSRRFKMKYGMNANLVRGNKNYMV